jgi:hypothetical protein
MSLIQDLDKIRELQGREPLPDPSVIQGFDQNSPPPPAYDPDVPAEWLDPDLDQHDPRTQLPPSPLIPQSAPVPAPVAMPSPSVAAEPARSAIFALVVADRLASWKSREVLLTEEEEKRVRAIVLGAIQRELVADLEAVTTKRRRRKPVAAVVTNAGVLATEKPEKRKPGRPRKNSQ